MKSAVEDISGVPVYPAPARKKEKCIIYKWYPGYRDSSVTEGRIELRFVSEDYGGALDMLSEVRKSLLPGGISSGRIGSGASAVSVSSSETGCSSGYIHSTGLYFVKCSFVLSGRSDIYG